MKLTRYLILFTVLFLLSIISSCNAPFKLDKPTTTPTATLPPVKTATPVPSPTETTIPASPTPEMAPICDPGTVSLPLPSECQLPIAEQSSVFCTKKDPYNLISMNPNSTYEVGSEQVWCSDAGMKEGRKLVTCTGVMSTSFELRVCDPNCAVPVVQVTSAQCPDGYKFNIFQGCCTQEPLPVDQSCVTLKLQTTRCVVDCGQYKKKSKCEKNGYACKWDDTSKVCLLR
jgi:hypothetical protein